MYTHVRSLLLFLAVLLPLAATAQNAQQTAIRTMLQQRDAEVKRVIGTRSTFTDAQRNQLKTLINGVIDFDAMGRVALGSAWNDLTAAQRSQFVASFAEVVRNQSVADLGIYRARISYGEITVTGNTALARTSAAVDNRTIRVDYRMALANNEWRVTDILLDDVSTAEGYARQFQQVIRRRGFDGLMQSLQRRIERGS